MTEDPAAPAALGDQAFSAPSALAQPAAGTAPETPARAQHVEAVAEAAAKIEQEAAALTAVIASEAKQSSPAAATLSAEVEAWFVEQIQNSPVSRAGAEIYNHVRAAVDALKTRLSAL